MSDAIGSEITTGSLIIDFRSADTVGIVTGIEWDHPHSADRGVAWLTVEEVRPMAAGGHVSTGRVFRSIRASRATVVPAPSGPTPVVPEPVPDYPAEVVPELQVGPAIVPGMVRTTHPELTAAELLGIAPVCRVLDVYRTSGLVKTPECFVPITAEQASALAELDSRPEGPVRVVIVAEVAGAHRMLAVGPFDSVTDAHTWWAPRWNKLSRFRLVVVPDLIGANVEGPEPASEEGPEQRNAAVLADWLFHRPNGAQLAAVLLASQHGVIRDVAGRPCVVRADGTSYTDAFDWVDTLIWRGMVERTGSGYLCSGLGWSALCQYASLALRTSPYLLALVDDLVSEWERLYPHRMMRLGTLVPCADQYVTLHGRMILVNAIVAGGQVEMGSRVAELQALLADGYVQRTGTQLPVSLVITDKGRKIMEGTE